MILNTMGPPPPRFPPPPKKRVPLSLGKPTTIQFCYSLLATGNEFKFGVMGFAATGLGFRVSGFRVSGFRGLGFMGCLGGGFVARMCVIPSCVWRC